MIRKMFFIAAAFCALAVAAKAETKRVVESPNIFCPLVWSADGSQTTQKYAATPVHCNYNRVTIFAQADFELEMLCSSSKCVHLSEMNPDQETYYKSLKNAQNSANLVPHTVCVHRTPKSEMIQVAVVYNYKGDCWNVNVVRTYNHLTNLACMVDVGCIPLQYVMGQGTEYDVVRNKSNGAVVSMNGERMIRNQTLDRLLTQNPIDAIKQTSTPTVNPKKDQSEPPQKTTPIDEKQKIETAQRALSKATTGAKEVSPKAPSKPPAKRMQHHEKKTMKADYFSW
jgi:hypothetical protein